MGGSVNAIAFMKGEIEESAWGYGERYRTGQDVVVGVNKYVSDEVEVPDILKVDQASEDAQVERLAAFKADRDAQAVEAPPGGDPVRGGRVRQPAAGPARGAARPLHPGRGVRRDARRVRRVPARHLIRGRSPAGEESRPGGRIGAPMPLQAQRTLVKSQPELWAEVSDAAALAKHLGELGEIRITRAEPERTVAWEAESASGTLDLEPAGWGTRVTITAARPDDGEPAAAPVEAPAPAPPRPRRWRTPSRR